MRDAQNLVRFQKKLENKEKKGCPISKRSRMYDLRSRGNLDLIPKYSDATHLGDVENFVRFPKKVVGKRRKWDLRSQKT